MQGCARGAFISTVISLFGPEAGQPDTALPRMFWILRLMKAPSSGAVITAELFAAAISAALEFGVAVTGTPEAHAASGAPGSWLSRAPPMWSGCAWLTRTAWM